MDLDISRELSNFGPNGKNGILKSTFNFSSEFNEENICDWLQVEFPEIDNGDGTFSLARANNIKDEYRKLIAISLIERLCKDPKKQNIYEPRQKKALIKAGFKLESTEEPLYFNSGKISKSARNKSKSLDAISYYRNCKVGFFLRHTDGNGGAQDMSPIEINLLMQNAPKLSAKQNNVLAIVVEGTYWTNEQIKSLNAEFKKNNRRAIAVSTKNAKKIKTYINATK